MDRYMRNVLLVESDPVERERLAAALEGDGFEVVLCPGPTAPDYTCVGGRVGRCPLATDGCVVVDTDQDGDAAVSERRPRSCSTSTSRPAPRRHAERPADRQRRRARVLELRHHPDTDTLLTAAWWAASPKATGHLVVRGAWS